MIIIVNNSKHNKALGTVFPRITDTYNLEKIRKNQQMESLTTAQAEAEDYSGSKSGSGK